jgi:hypothetical protein
MNVGIDWVALCVIGAAMVIGQIRQIPGQVRYFILAGAFTVVAVYRLNQGFRDNFNLAMVALCAIFAVNYVIKGIRYRRPGSDD